MLYEIILLIFTCLKLILNIKKGQKRECFLTFFFD
jgi:hypothetical protein